MSMFRWFSTKNVATVFDRSLAVIWYAISAFLSFFFFFFPFQFCSSVFFVSVAYTLNCVACVHLPLTPKKSGVRTDARTAMKYVLCCPSKQRFVFNDLATRAPADTGRLPTARGSRPTSIAWFREWLRYFGGGRGERANPRRTYAGIRVIAGWFFSLLPVTPWQAFSKFNDIE